MTFRRGRGVPLHNRVEKQVEKPPQERRKKTSDISSVSLCHSACGYEVGRIVAILQMVITEISEVRSFPYVRITCYLVAKSCPALWPRGLQHARLPYPFLSPRAFSNACPLSWWCHPTISSSVVPFSSCSQSFPQGLFQWVSSLHQVAKVLKLQHQDSWLENSKIKDFTDLLWYLGD